MVQLTVGSIEDPYNNVSLNRSDDIVRDGKTDSLGRMVLANSMVLSGTGDDIHSVMLTVDGVGTMEESKILSETYSEEYIKEETFISNTDDMNDDTSGTVDNISDSVTMDDGPMVDIISGPIVESIKDSVIMKVDDTSGTIVDKINDSVIRTVEISGASLIFRVSVT